MTDKTELIKRYIFLLAGLFVNGLGVSFITKAGLGTSPITSIPYTLSLGFTDVYKRQVQKLLYVGKNLTEQ